MAWNRGTMSAEEILGMKPEDLRTKLDSAATREDLTAATAKMDEFGSALSAIQASIAALSAPRVIEDPNITADLNDPTTQMLTDPAGFVTRQTQNISNQASQARADILEMRARQKYAGAFSKYGDEIMAGANRFSLDQRAGENFWDFHIRTVMGDKYIKGETSGSYPSLVGSGSFAPGSPDTPDPNGNLDPAVAAFLKERGVPLDKAAKIKSHMIDNGEPVSIDTYKKVVNG
jgi:hypothetical protein